MILLDTCVVAWMASEPEKLSRPASEAIRNASSTGGIAIAAITLWELAQLMTAGRLRITGAVEAFVEEICSRTAILPITPRIAALAIQFPPSYPKDPSDRLIGATAISEGIALVTKDREIRNSAGRIVRTIW